MGKRALGIDLCRESLRVVQMTQKGDRFLVEQAFTAPTRRDTDSSAEILVAPVLDERVPLEHARAELETRYGKAFNAWKKTDAGWEMETRIPANAQGQIILPASPGDIAVLAGNAKFVTKDGDSVANVTAGQFSFRINAGGN